MSSTSLHFRRACPADYPALETLLNALYIGNLSADEAQASGFLATPFTQAQIAIFNDGLGALVAVEQDTVLGFLGLMESDAPFAPPVVQAMTAAMRQTSFDGQPLAACKPFLFGPIAIARQARGRGIFRGLYQAMWNFLDPSRYELGLAFIHQENHHSLTVHQQALGVTVLAPFMCGDAAYWLVAYRRPAALFPPLAG
ncbi:MAG: N-acetyltransferase [Proteobacteria bacterium]|nr:N-acetyltransferase [Pseudomonadota bacterium]MCL2308351.1 N-acetyltransferase [Pseudomonadota bacterium]